MNALACFTAVSRTPKMAAAPSESGLVSDSPDGWLTRTSNATSFGDSPIVTYQTVIFGANNLAVVANAISWAVIHFCMTRPGGYPSGCVMQIPPNSTSFSELSPRCDGIPGGSGTTATGSTSRWEVAQNRRLPNLAIPRTSALHESTRNKEHLS
jgi:hypothetical protein